MKDTYYLFPYLSIVVQKTEALVSPETRAELLAAAGPLGRGQRDAVRDTQEQEPADQGSGFSFPGIRLWSSHLTSLGEWLRSLLESNGLFHCSSLTNRMEPVWGSPVGIRRFPQTEGECQRNWEPPV